MAFELKDGITLCIAAVGAVLGVINTLHSLDQKRVKLRVVPKYAFLQGDGLLRSVKPVRTHSALHNEMGCIEITNLSAFPVGIDETGFTVSGDPRKTERNVILCPDAYDGKKFARRLEPCESVSGYFSLGRVHANIKKAYVITDCGAVAYGTTTALKDIVQRLRQSSGTHA
jgi:hypothetical protein